MEGHINTFHVGESHLLLENHLVQGPNEEGIQESTMEDGKTNDPTDEFKV